MIQLFALSLNPNLSTEQFAELAEKITDAYCRKWKIAGEEMLKLPVEQRALYFSLILSVLVT